MGQQRLLLLLTLLVCFSAVQGQAQAFPIFDAHISGLVLPEEDPYDVW